MGSTPVLVPIELGASDVALLGMFVPAAEENHERAPQTPQIDADPWADMDPKFLNTASDRAQVAEISGADPREPFPNPNLDRFVQQSPIPPRERHDPVRPNIEANLLLNRHGRTVA
jgi:hypothetical protein